MVTLIQINIHHMDQEMPIRTYKLSNSVFERLVLFFLRPNNAPPPYPQYPPQPAAYPQYPPQPGAYPQYPPQPGAYPQYSPQPAVVVYPMNRTFWYNLAATPITPSLRALFIITGILYLIWGVLGIGLEIGVIVNSSYRYYVGFIGGGFLIGAGISMLIAGCRTSYIMVYLVRMLTVTLVFCILGFILSIVSYTTSTSCFSWSFYDCDSTVAAQIKATLIAVFVLATIQTIISLVVTSNAHRATSATPVSNAPMS